MLLMLRNHFLAVILFLSPIILGNPSYAQSPPSRSSHSVEIRFYLPITQKQFPGLIKQLQKALGNAGLGKLKLTTIDYWHPYQHGIRQGRPAIYFAAPHFSSWLINTHEFAPTLRLAGKLQYVIAARRSDSHIFEVSDLASKTVCTNATMDLSFLLVRESMTRNVLAAETERVDDVAKQMTLNNKRCDAFSLSEHLFLEFATQEPFKFIRLQQSEEFANYAYLLHPDIEPETKRALKKFLISKKANQLLQPMYRLFSKEPNIVSARASSYPPKHMKSLEAYWGSSKPKVE